MAAERLALAEALPDLIAAYEQKRDDVRGNALYGLGLLGSEEVIPFSTEARSMSINCYHPRPVPC